MTVCRRRAAASVMQSKRGMSRRPLRLLTLLTGATLIASSLAAAQQPAAQPSQQPPVEILSGCLRSSAADTAVAGPSGRLYTLEVVTPPRPGTDTPGSPAAAPSKTTYSLAAPESLALSKHADHEVQLTGRLQAPAPTASPAGGAVGSTPKPPAGGGHRTFEVSALKMLSAKCP